MVLGLIYAWSIFRTPIAVLFPQWTIAQISFTFTISMVFFCLAGLVAGRLYAQTGPRPILLLGALFIFAGFFEVSCLNPQTPQTSLYMLYAMYGVLCGSAVGLAYNAIISTVLSWYQDKVGLASGILLMGFGAGGMVFGSVVKVLIGILGLLATFKIIAVIMACLLFIGAVILNPNTDAGKQKSMQQSNSEVNISTLEMLKTSSFWLLMVWLVLLSSVGLLIVNSAASIAAAYGASEVLGLIVSVFNGIGRVFIGTLFDRFAAKKTMYLNNAIYITAGILLCCGVQTNNVVLIFLGLIFAGTGYGGNPTITSASVQSSYGRDNYAVNFSVANLSIIPAAFLGPLVSSVLLEKSGGSYATTFILALTLSVIALGVCHILHKKAR